MKFQIHTLTLIDFITFFVILSFDDVSLNETLHNFLYRSNEVSSTIFRSIINIQSRISKKVNMPDIDWSLKDSCPCKFCSVPT